MTVWSQMNGLVEFLVGVLTTSHHVIHLAVLVLVRFSVFLCGLFAVLQGQLLRKIFISYSDLCVCNDVFVNLLPISTLSQACLPSGFVSGL